ncbi:hypothetical protein CRG98_010744 [Punica granatum]|uniref:DUF7745 domain-containing protein n=1 Tax=Punica granatum TaxID=22663 RepID=A0A2I0KKC1_PUNGR|nr:hypothetical protein CRG98_010744 [Punica granatum]
MSYSTSFPHLDRVTPPLEEISRVWAYSRQVDRDYIRTFVGDIPSLAIRRSDWNFLGPATLLFPRSASHIDTALASIVFQVAGGYGYEVALLAETMRSLNRIMRKTDRRLRGSPILLEIWLQSHANPFGLVRPVMFFTRPESIISRLLPLLHVEERKVSEWIKIFRKISPRGFQWRIAWMPPGPMALRCRDFNGVPLVSHVGSTTYFPARVMRQLGGLQTVPKDTVRTEFEHTWWEGQTSVDRPNDVEWIMATWNETSKLWRSTFSASIDGVHPRSKIPPIPHRTETENQIGILEEINPPTSGSFSTTGNPSDTTTELRKNTTCLFRGTLGVSLAANFNGCPLATLGVPATIAGICPSSIDNSSNAHLLMTPHALQCSKARLINQPPTWQLTWPSSWPYSGAQTVLPRAPSCLQGRDQQMTLIPWILPTLPAKNRDAPASAMLVPVVHPVTVPSPLSAVPATAPLTAVALSTSEPA